VKKKTLHHVTQLSGVSKRNDNGGAAKKIFIQRQLRSAFQKKEGELRRERRIMEKARDSSVLLDKRIGKRTVEKERGLDRRGEEGD